MFIFTHAQHRNSTVKADIVWFFLVKAPAGIASSLDRSIFFQIGISFFIDDLQQSSRLLVFIFIRIDLVDVSCFHVNKKRRDPIGLNDIKQIFFAIDQKLILILQDRKIFQDRLIILHQLKFR